MKSDMYVTVITSSLCNTENGYVVFESCQNRGTHAGILPDGSAKNPNETAMGEHAQFWVIVSEMVSDVIKDVYCDVSCLVFQPDPNAQSASVPVKQAGPVSVTLCSVQAVM